MNQAEEYLKNLKVKNSIWLVVEQWIDIDTNEPVTTATAFAYERTAIKYKELLEEKRICSSYGYYVTINRLPVSSKQGRKKHESS